MSVFFMSDMNWYVCIAYFSKTASDFPSPDFSMSPPAQSTKWADFTRRSQVLANKESLDAPTQPVEKRQEDTSLQDIFATAWQLVFKAVMAEAPDTKVSSFALTSPCHLWQH